MWILLAAVAVLLGGTATLWLRRRDATGAAGPAERRPGWELALDDEARTVFMEGLRASQDDGRQFAVDESHGVVTMSDPPRLISLYLLAEGFAHRGQAALHDPEGTVAVLLDQHTATERPGVLHLRDAWLTGEVDGMDARRFTEAVGAIACPPGAAGVGPWHGDADLGYGLVTVLGNTLLFDLGRMLDRYRASREQLPDAPVGVVLRNVVTRVIADSRPAMTWARPPSGPEGEAALNAASAPATPPN